MVEHVDSVMDSILCECCAFQMENSNQSSSVVAEQQYQVASCKSQTQREREKATLSLNMSPARIAAQDIPTPGGPDADDSGELWNLFP